MLLAGDIGGTKTNLAVYAPAAGRLGDPRLEKTFPSADYPSLEAIIQEFLQLLAAPIDHAAFGVAGPVVEGTATITNLPWSMSEEQLSTALDIPSVQLLNDLAATAYSVPYLNSDDLATLNAGEPDPKGAVAIIAPGTGLGEAFITVDAHGGYSIHPSEGGHSDFAPTTIEEIELLRYLLEHRGPVREEHQRYAHVSYERICSGRGLPNIYAFLKYRGKVEPDWLAALLSGDSEPTPIIVDAALDTVRPADICQATLDLFVDILGAEAGNLALKVLATGGVYLGGGIPPRILTYLENGRFRSAFERKGRFGPLLSKMPVHVIRNPKAALLGAAYAGLAKQSS
ncbi:MAG: glucokinase [Ktedonobacterales bacterium]